jgi:hypothetical protein
MREIMAQNQYAVSGFFNDVIHDRLYFGDNDGGTSTIQSKDYRIFINEVGTQTSNISSGADITQTDADTSLEGVGGTIPNGEWFVITAIGINLHLSNTQATQPFTNDADVSLNVTPLYRVSPIPLFDAIMSQCTFELYRNSNERLEKGNICEYPCEFGNTGFAGGSGAAVPAVTSGPLQAAYTTNPTVYIDGAGTRFRELTVYQELKQNDQFRGIFKVNREIALASTLLCGYIDFYLVGRALTDDQHDQFVAEFGGKLSRRA